MLAVKDELRNITTFNLVANTSSILEKIFWALIAICGTLFIYDVVYIQLDYWQDNPSLVTKEIQHLSNMPIPSITFCHKGFHQLGPVEKFANFLNPEKDVPKEVLSVRNEFLKVQFLKIKHGINETINYCNWLSNLRRIKKSNFEKSDQWDDHPILSYQREEEYGGIDGKNLLKQCLDFSNSIKELSTKTGKSIARIKSNIYHEIENGVWWNFDQFFKQFKKMIEGNDKGMEKRITEGENILIIGGNEEGLNPLVLHVDDSEMEFDMCRKEIFPRRPMAYGEFIDDSLIICGGLDMKTMDIHLDCQIFNQKGEFKFKFEERIFGSFVKFNPSAFWITGGLNRSMQNYVSTLIVTENSSTIDVNLPISFAYHCMVYYKENLILIIGGTQNGDENSNKSWIINTNDRSNLVEGPSLTKGRESFSCGRVEDDSGNVMVLVVGGTYEDTMEILNTTEMKKWVLGPKLPHDLSNSVMVITPMTKRILLIGGSSSQLTGLKKPFDSILELVNDLSEWREVDFAPRLERSDHLALYQSSGGMMHFCDKESLDELQYLYMIGNDYLLKDEDHIENRTLYDLSFKGLLEPEKIGSFLHYAYYDTLQSGLLQNKISMTTSFSKLMTTEKGMLDLTWITKLFAINDFKNIELLEDYGDKNNQVSLHDIKDCYDAFKSDQNQNQDEFENFNEKKMDKSYKMPSPCFNLTLYSLCKGYCEWHKNVIENWSTTKINVLQRHALPQDNIIQKSSTNGKQIAEQLFGKDRLRENLTNMISGSPLALLCKESKRKEFFGDTVDGFDIEFCNSSKVIQTDVGTCIATDPIQYLENRKIFSSDDISYMKEGLKDIEHVMVLHVDKFGLLNEPPNYKTMIPRTNHHDFKVQMQIHEQKGFPKILYGLNQDLDQRSISLKPGYEYKIELYPYGQVSTDDFKGMSIDKRGCRLGHETLSNATHPIYSRDNCIYDCLVHEAYKTCRCAPWDFVNNIKDPEECDIFGRTCFFNMIERLTHIQVESCSHCMSECDWIKYSRKIGQPISLALTKNRTETTKSKKIKYLCNHYLCISYEERFKCKGSSTLCNFLWDAKRKLSPPLMRESILPYDYDTEGMKRINSTFFKMAQIILDNMIIVRLHYKSSEVEMTKLDVRTTTTDKIANFGGTFGIWAELTGCSLLGLINLLIISFKLLFRSQE